MSHPEWKAITVRKEHECCFCHNPIHKGESAKVAAWRAPRYDDRDVQVGVEYVRIYLHLPDYPTCTSDGTRQIVELENETL